MAERMDSRPELFFQHFPPGTYPLKNVDCRRFDFGQLHIVSDKRLAEICSRPYIARFHSVWGRTLPMEAVEQSLNLHSVCQHVILVKGGCLEEKTLLYKRNGRDWISKFAIIQYGPSHTDWGSRTPSHRKLLCSGPAKHGPRKQMKPFQCPQGALIPYYNDKIKKKTTRQPLRGNNIGCRLK